MCNDIFFCMLQCEYQPTFLVKLRQFLHVRPVFFLRAKAPYNFYAALRGFRPQIKAGKGGRNGTDFQRTEKKRTTFGCSALVFRGPINLRRLLLSLITTTGRWGASGASEA
jgi:hypothetical protein